MIERDHTGDQRQGRDDVEEDEGAQWRVIHGAQGATRGVPTPLIGHVHCHLCNGRGRMTVLASRALRLYSLVGCIHCATTGWCRCERCLAWAARPMDGAMDGPDYEGA